MAYTLKVINPKDRTYANKIENQKFPDLNTARKSACRALPADSSESFVAVYSNGKYVGRVVHYRGCFMYSSEVKHDTYQINPRTGRVADWIVL